MKEAPGAMQALRGIMPHVLACVAGLAIATGCHTETEPPSDVRAEHASPDPAEHLKTKPAGVLPSFRTIGAESGLEFERYDDIGPQRRILEVNGGGVALFDFDRDGWLDVFLTSGCRLPLKLGDRTRRGELFRNKGRSLDASNTVLRFEPATGESQLVQHGYTHGCAVGDVDADGFDDLYITAFGPNALWRNNGDGTFTDITDQTGTHVPQWSSSAAFADLNGDGHLDLYVVNYLDESDESPMLCPNSDSPDGYVSCAPAMFEGVDDVLFLSDGAGGFVDATAAAGIAGRRGKGLGLVICDLGGDRRPEIYVANDGEANFLFATGAVEGREPRVEARSERSEVRGPRSEAGPQPSALRQPSIPGYVDLGVSSGTALSEAGYAQAGMGVAAGDYNADGTSDLFLTHFFDDTNTLYANRGGLVFDDATRASRLGPPSRPMLGWGTAFLDPDNDGRLDLMVVNGHVDDRTWMSRSEPYHMRPQMFRNAGDGTFEDVSEWSGEYFREEWLGRGLAVGDLDRDGRLDAAVSHQLAPSVVLWNDTQTRNVSLVLRLVGTSSSRSGYGTRVEVVGAEAAVVRELVGGASFQSASAPELHLGLGANRQATIRIRWPSGALETHPAVTAGTWTAVEGHGLRPLGPPLRRD